MHLPDANNNKYSKFNTSKSISYQIQKTMMWNHCQKGKINKYVQIFSFFQLKPDGWKENRQFLAKSCIHLKDYSAALHWLDQANELPVKNPDVSFSCQKSEMSSKRELLKILVTNLLLFMASEIFEQTVFNLCKKYI
jgi:hypothetical protein